MLICILKYGSFYEAFRAILLLIEDFLQQGVFVVVFFGLNADISFPVKLQSLDVHIPFIRQNYFLSIQYARLFM